eukprot:TRINITY_DN2509_c0_g1_i1.p4 TRINITY_DN2509_c0_g1~~TRINITY_DN2509_c0_g1_i1.p4  ORF type:complete len:103 (+),score=24.24 TRINITY_DN2509_c0_g1_i1:74-382(+)
MSGYATRAFAEIASRIFRIAPPLPEGAQPLRTGTKILRSLKMSDRMSAWYPPPIEKFIAEDDPYVDDKVARREVKLKLLKARGKGPPKKGAGKRALRKSGGK